MKTIITSVVLALLVCLLAQAEPSKPSYPISLTLDHVHLSDMVRMINRITGADFIFDPSDLGFRGEISISIREKPWKPAFRAALAQHGFVLIEDAPEAGLYSILPAKSKAVAARRVAAEKAVTAIDAVLAQLDKGDLAAAKELLSRHRDHNAEILKSAAEKKKSANKTNGE